MLRSGRQRNRGSISGTVKRIALTPRFRIGSGSTKPPIQWAPRVPSSLLGDKAVGAGSEPFQSSAKAKNEWSCTSIPPYGFKSCTIRNITVIY